jgi:hydroxyacylglutathione hydrolase
VSSEGAKLSLTCQEVGPWGTNAYSLECRTSGQSVLIDPAGEPETLLAMLQGTEPVAILVTHSHMDHIGALRELREALRVPVMAHRAATGLKADRWLENGDILQVGEHSLRVWHTPGHTEESVCYAVVGGHRVMVGDAIFEGGPGHTSSLEAFETTLGTLRDVILSWSDESVCYPGHGPSFTLGDKRPLIEAFLAKDHGDFCGDATWEM